jgi:hypothetical protein
VARRDGGADREVGRDVVARWEGEGRARRGRWEGPVGGGGRGGGVDGFGRLLDGKGGWPDGIGTLPDKGGVPDGMGGNAGRGFVGAGWDGKVSEREGCR